MQRVFEGLRSDVDVVVVGGLSMGASLALRLAADRGDQVAGIAVVNPAVATRRLDAKALPVLKHLVPGWPALGNDIKKPGGEEYPYPKTPLKALHTFVQQWKPLHRGPAEHHPAAADLPLGGGPRRRPVVGADHHQPGLQPRRRPSALLEDSYHVATLDNDAPAIFEESAAFVARVAADAPAP